MSVTKLRYGTPIVWKNTGGNYAITLASLAATKGRCGVKADLGETIWPNYAVSIALEFGSAPTAGGVVEVYWSSSSNNTTFMGGATGTDAAYKDGEEAEWAKQLTFVASFVCTADGSGTVQNQFLGYLKPPARYGCPVIINKTSQSIINNNTNSVLTLTPVMEEIV